MDELQYLPTGLIGRALSAFSLAIVTYGTWKFLSAISRKNKRKNYPRDTVILHQFPKGLRAPSASPFPIKLETWYIYTQIIIFLLNIHYLIEFQPIINRIRMAGIKYEVIFFTEHFSFSVQYKLFWFF